MKRLLSALVIGCLMGCSSLTPERLNVLASIAGQAAFLGAQEWLRAHPDQKPAFDAVIQAITIALRAGNTNQAVELLASLPTTTLRGDAGELYVSDRLVVWDNDAGKATRITGAGEGAVLVEIRRGLRKAVAPVPPMLPKHHGKPAEVLSITPEGAPTPPPLPRVQNAYWHHPIGSIHTNDIPKTDSQLDAEFEAIKAKLAKPK